MANSSTSWNIAQHINKDHINCHSDKNTGKILLFNPWICVFEVKSDKIHKNGIYLFLINFHFFVIVSLLCVGKMAAYCEAN